MKKNTKTKPMTRGPLSRKLGINIETIRYYEKIGIMPNPYRSENGYRLYDEESVKRLAFIRRSRKLGFSLDEIRELLKLIDKKIFTCEEIATLVQKHLDDIQKKIKDLKKIEQHMKNMISQCSREKIPDCAIIDALFDK